MFLLVLLDIEFLTAPSGQSSDWLPGLVIGALLGLAIMKAVLVRRGGGFRTG